MFTVRVINQEGDPIEGVEVRISFTIPIRGISPEERTDPDGRAEFGPYDDGEIRVYVDGSNQDNYHYSEGDEITITV